MAREMTPQERAAQLYGSLTCTTYRDGYQDPDNDIALIADVLQQTRRAALLECRDEINKLIGKDSGNWNRAIVYAADVANKLAQEGS